jgi:methylmalonyl-CoA mutase N-terminal domain/subunit
MIGTSALGFQEKIERGEEKIVGVNSYQIPDESGLGKPTERPDIQRMKAHVERFKAFKNSRSQDEVRRVLDDLARAANSSHENVFQRVVEAAERGATHGEIVGRLRKELGFGHPLVLA